MNYMKAPSKTFKAYLRATGTGDFDALYYNLGRMSMALEVITQIKTLEELRALASDVGRAEAVTALETLLQDCGLRDVAYEMYDRLCEWRRVKFRPDHELPVLLLEETAAFGGAVARVPLRLPHDPESSLDDASPPASSPLESKPPSSTEERHGRGKTLGPISLLGGSSYEEDLKKQIG